MDIGSETLDSKGQTALHIACANGHLHIAQYLVNDKECSVMVGDVHGHNPFVLSLINKHWKVAEFLLTVAPSSDSFKKHIGLLHYGESLVAEVAHEALNETCSSDCFRLAKFLKEKRHINNIILACEKGDLSELQRVLEESQLDIGSEIHDSKGQTALHIACANGHLHIAQYLVNDKECSVMVGDVHGHNPFVLSLINKHWKVAEFLLTVAPSSDSFKKHIGLLHYGESLVAEVAHEALNETCSSDCFKLAKFLKEKRHINNIILACEKGDLSELQHVLEKSQLDIGSETLDNKGQTALHIACANGHLHIAQYLVNEKECSAIIEDTSGRTPFALSLLNKQWKVADFLVTSSPNTTAYHDECIELIHNQSLTSRLADEAIMASCKGGYFELVKCLTDNYDHIMISKTYIKIAFLNGHWEIAKACLELLQKGDTPKSIGLSSPGSDQLIKGTPFASNPTCDGGYLDVVRYLHEMDLCSPTEIGGKPLETALSSGHWRIVHFCIKYYKCRKPDNLSELHAACITGDKKKVKASLFNSESTLVNKPDQHGITAMHYASFDEPKILSIIINVIKEDNGMLFNSQDKNGNTPLHFAIIGSCGESVRILLKAPVVNINLVNCKGETPLHIACKQHEISNSVLEMLVADERCDLSIQDDNGDTVLHIAVERNASVIELITVYKRCNPIITNHDGMTPLQLAFNTDELSTAELLIRNAKCSHEDIAKVLSFQGLLHRTVQADRMSLFKVLIEIKECIASEVNDDGQTPLHVACTTKSLEYIQALIQLPTCDLNIQDDNGDTALHVAACSEWNSAEKVQCILDSGRYEPNITNKQGYTPLHSATANNRFDSVKILLNSAECNPNIQDLQGNTALHLSIHHMSAVGIELFLMCDKVDLNIQNINGNTPLHTAVVKSPHILGKLFGHPNCNPRIINHDGMTPLLLAFNTDELSVAELLIHCARCSYIYKDIAKVLSFQGLLHRTVQADRMSLFKFLIEIKECIASEVNDDGQTPLHVACTTKSLEYIQALIQLPTCDLNIQDDNGDTALHVAACSEWNSAKKVQCLLDGGKCDPNITNKQGYTPLHTATTNNEFDSVKILLNSAECNPNIQDLQGNTALHLSIHHMSAVGIELFLMCEKVDVNIQNINGNTPLHRAVVKGPHTLKELIRHPYCNPCIINHDGMTPLQLLVCDRLSLTDMEILLCCAQYSHVHTAKAFQGLLHHAVRANKKSFVMISIEIIVSKFNHGGQTALHVACTLETFKYVKILTRKPICDLNSQDDNGDTALHVATCSKFESAEKIQCILKCDPNIFNTKPFLKRADVNIQNKEGNTPLHIAVIQDAPTRVIKILVHHDDCNPSIVNNEGMTPLQIVINKKRLNDANIMITNCSPEDIKKIVDINMSDILFYSVLGNYITLIQRLVVLQREKINLRYSYLGERITPLHAACRKGYCDMIEILLENGADVQATDSSGDAPIHIVCKILKLNCLNILLGSNNCNPNQQNADGDTALHIVCGLRQNTVTFVKALIAMPGIDPEIANHVGLTPVEMAGPQYFEIQIINNFLKQKQSSLQTYLKIFVVGNSGTGKSTLIKAVTTEASQLLKYAIFPKMKFVNPSDVPPHTAGIVPIPFNSKHFGHAVLYDFAGQHKYYSSHAAVMENLILPTPPLFLLLIDISKPIEEIKEELVYWWQFINNLSQRAATPPHVMFVGSHKDKVRARGENPRKCHSGLRALSQWTAEN